MRRSRQAATTAELEIHQPRGSTKAVVAVPETYMNRSGESVRLLVSYFGIEDLSRLVIVHDELDLAPGRLKIKFGGGLAGHNGLKSIRDHLGTVDFARVRVGVGKPSDTNSTADWVLAPPTDTERHDLDEAIEVAADAVEVIANLTTDLALVAGRFNR